MQAVPSGQVERAWVHSILELAPPLLRGVVVLGRSNALMPPARQRHASRVGDGDVARGRVQPQDLRARERTARAIRQAKPQGAFGRGGSGEGRAGEQKRGLRNAGALGSRGADLERAVVKQAGALGT